jgi:hypothetical protein
MSTISQCGYLVEQDYMKEFFKKREDDDYDTFDLLDDIYLWWYDLARPIRTRTPIPQSESSFAIHPHVIKLPCVSICSRWCEWL